ncbi:MAG: DUF1344 domain-containing protein [Pseudomonadota bacterium]|uniref:DUF1344 domain-containing protein n=1 Tax=Roseibium aggregatum TaxID=187304 RepID=UPI001E2CA1F7|nr:DUF1344 domain-containing protein [Roseibium aggregatum]MEC9463531.1 DUF1344 domain-containing protein [Pseudomonadota bacterium]UES49834.1 DUF1344 domain-containing protein [Roseibium aggregatum]
MPKWLIAIATAPLLLTLPPHGLRSALADEIAGTILSIDPFEGLFSLEDGSRFLLTDTLSSQDLMIGSEVLITFTTTMSGDRLVTALQVVN